MLGQSKLPSYKHRNYLHTSIGATCHMSNFKHIKFYKYGARMKMKTDSTTVRVSEINPFVFFKVIQLIFHLYISHIRIN